ncbi:MAG: hypothetical protein SVR81_05015 [Chloroflexota bacterium]|nr:hypothetical protein [Chloroflexota bacterium]
MPEQTFSTLLLIARPAAGKSEVINYLKNTPLPDRIRRFHIGAFSEIDDFPMLWAWFEEDALLARMGHPRLHTDAEGYFKEDYLWRLLIERIGLEYQKRRRDGAEETIIIEFSRGAEHGGYEEAFAHLTDQILTNLAILYIDVPWEESLRKNRARFNPKRPDSILEHGLSDEKLERLYRETDWETLTENAPERLRINGHDVPYVVFDNTDDVTTAQGPELGMRLEAVLGELWDLYQD